MFCNDIIAGMGDITGSQSIIDKVSIFSCWGTHQTGLIFFIIADPGPLTELINQNNRLYSIG